MRAATRPKPIRESQKVLLVYLIEDCSHSMLPGRTMARSGLRMMPPFPSSPLKFRTVSFPQYGFKAGYRRGLPGVAGFSRPPVCHRPSCPPLTTLIPRPVPGTAVRLCTSVRATLPLYPRDPRSGPGYAVPVHHHLTGPMRPTHGHTTASLTKQLICGALAVRPTTAPRRPTSGSELSLVVLYRHVAL
jgi:hypothetical protein